jgi:DNA polymerase III alpha subunit
MSHWRPWLQRDGIMSSCDLGHAADGQRVRAAGLLVVHQAPPTAKGHHFLTLEDEFGLINVVVRPAIVARDRAWFHGGGVLVVDGLAQRDDTVLNLVALRVAPLGQGA